MNIPGMTPEIRNLMDLWCQWCVERSYVPFDEWLTYTHGGDTLKAILAMVTPEREFVVKIRRVGTTRYVGHNLSTYALCIDDVNTSVYSDEPKAKVWDSLTGLRKFCGQASRKSWYNSSFPDYECVFSNGDVVPLDEALKGGVEK